jgi:hypothetical protein
MKDSKTTFRGGRSAKMSLVLIGTVAFAAAPLGAQWSKQPDPGVPRTRDGKVNLAAPPTKTREAKPDLSGVWLPQPDPNGKPEGVENAINPRYMVDITADLKPEDVPIEPWAAAVFKERLDSQGTLDPTSRCQPTGVPAADAIPIPYKIIQTPRTLLVLYEENSIFRQIFLDGRPLPKDAEPRWMGYSAGRWEGDTLVVESAGFRDRGWLDRLGHPHSDGLHVIERFRRPDIGHLEIAVTINDPKTYRTPLTYTLRQTLLADEDLLEYFCTENEKDRTHF